MYLIHPPPPPQIFIISDEAERSKLPGPVQEVIDSTLPVLTAGKSLLDLNRDFMQRHEDSLDHVILGMATLSGMR